MFDSLSLSIEAITVQRNYQKIFQPFSISLENSDSLYIQGSNGVGKTTALRALAGITTTYQGRIILNHIERKEWLHHYNHNILYIGHHLSLKEELTAKENIDFILSIANADASEKKIWEIFDELKIPKQSRGLRYLSAGQRRRVALSRLWLEEKTIWILDEPFTALDAHSIDQLENKILSHQKRGGVIIFTSHQTPISVIFNKGIQLEAYHA